MIIFSFVEMFKFSLIFSNYAILYVHLYLYYAYMNMTLCIYHHNLIIKMSANLHLSAGLVTWMYWYVMYRVTVLCEFIFKKFICNVQCVTAMNFLCNVRYNISMLWFIRYSISGLWFTRYNVSVRLTRYYVSALRLMRYNVSVWLRRYNICTVAHEIQCFCVVNRNNVSALWVMRYNVSVLRSMRDTMYLCCGSWDTMYLCCSSQDTIYPHCGSPGAM